MNNILGLHPIIKNDIVRGEGCYLIDSKGLMVAIEFDDSLQARHIFEQILVRGILVGCNPDFNIIRFMPPLIITPEQIDNVIQNLKVILERPS